MNTGVVVPRNINVVSVSAFPALIDVFPDLRDESFFVVDDEIVILDRSRRIVDVVPAGPRTRFSHAGSMGGGGVSGGGVAALNLSPDEIRVVQQVLIERGLPTGEADSVLGTRTREALISFRRQQGIQQASGSIDTRTVSALGVSNKISATQSQTTTGQGQASQQQPAQQRTTGQTPVKPMLRRSRTSRQLGKCSRTSPRQPGSSQQNQPATTGQGGTQQPSGQTTGQAAPPAQGNNKGNNPPAANQNMPSGQSNQSKPSGSRASRPIILRARSIEDVMLSPASAGPFLCRGVVERCKSRPVNRVRTSTAAAAEAVRESGEKAIRVTARVRPPPTS